MTDAAKRYLKRHTERLIKDVGYAAACDLTGRSKATLGRYFSEADEHADRFIPVDAVAAMEAEIVRVAAEGVSEEERARAIQRMMDDAVFASDSLRTGARVFGQAITVGQTVADVEAWPERIGAVTVDDINAAARAVLDEKQSITGVLLPAAPQPEES